MPKWVKELHDAEWLRDAYASRTVREIGVLLNCAPSGVSQALKRHGITARPPGQPSAPDVLRDRAWLDEQYKLYTSWEIAEAIGCHQSTVIEALRSLDIPVLPSGKGRRRRKHPYKQMLGDDGKIIQEHRYLMEKHLGRKLDSNEHVHHIDGVKDNNALTNLVVLSKSDHHKLHGQDAKDHMKNHDYYGYDRVCSDCGQSFKGGNRALRCLGCRLQR